MSVRILRDAHCQLILSEIKDSLQGYNQVNVERYLKDVSQYTGRSSLDAVG